MKRYSIMARENQQGARDLELCQCDSNPEALVEAARAKRMRFDDGRGRKIQVPKYAHVFTVDHGKGSPTNG
jgi:hypothetical protein